MAVNITIGPVSVASAEVWLDNADDVLDRLESARDKLPFKMPLETFEDFRRFLGDARAALRGSVFEMPASYGVEELRHLVRYWFNVTQLDEAHRSSLGVSWSPDEARPFADALAAAVATAMASHPELREFAEGLAREWAECQPAFTAALD